MAHRRHPRYALRAPLENLGTRHCGKCLDCDLCGAFGDGDGDGWTTALLVWAGAGGENGADDVGFGALVVTGVSLPPSWSLTFCACCLKVGVQGLTGDVRDLSQGKRLS